MITIKLPYPVSTNRYWRNFKGRMVRSSEANSYKSQAGWIAKTCGVNLTENPVRMHIKLHPMATKAGLASKTCIDLDNALKVAIDALNGIAYVDDKQVQMIVAEVSTPLTDGGLTVLVDEITLPSKD